MCLYVTSSVTLLLLCTASLVSALPVYLQSQPFWYNPCGATLEPEPSDADPTDDPLVSWHEQLAKSLQKIHHQLKYARDLLVYKEFDQLYIEVRRGITDRQYIPNWVPRKGDVEALLAMETFTTNEMAQYLPVLLSDLQKFAVAFEQVYRDEHLSYDHSPREHALAELVSTLRLVMCEVEDALWSLDLSYGPPVGRAIMSPEERDVPDFTHRMIRDNGVIIKYRDFLSGWNRLIHAKELVKALRKYRIEGKARRKQKRESMLRNIPKANSNKSDT